MNINTKNNVNMASATTSQPKKNQLEVGQQDFLRLMTEQLKQQDPFAPVDGQQMILQMAQMSSAAGISEMNSKMTDISTKISGQTDAITKFLNDKL